ncbi:MAG: metallophosphoesterase family protein [Prolixibacteraceae bacterium]|jgi:acid phosphatase type 7|nr:metallophosphoesterase family protein [Prolixibacteraceae bacterium]
MYKTKMNMCLNIIGKLILGISIITFSSTIVFSQNNFPSPNPDRIVLNLTEDASTSVAVTWRTDKSVSEGFCELQITPDGRIDPTISKSFKAKTTAVKYIHENNPVVEANQHSFIFTDLYPGKKYIYRVGLAGFWSEWIEFETPSKQNDEFTFIYFGDPQNDLKSQWSRIIRRAYKHVPECSFMVYAGDIINNGGSDLEWEEWFKAGSFIYGSVPQIFTPGNHDYIDLELDPHWKTQFTQAKNGPDGLKESCFFVDYKNLRLISIDSATEGELEDENGNDLKNQKIWLDSILTTNTKDWVIITTHLPFYSPKENRDNSTLRKHFQPILEKHGVDMVLTGHDHSYGRGMATDNPDMKPSIIYVVSVSGPKLYEAGNKEWMQQKGSFLQLYQTIRINDDVLEYEAFTANGTLFDKFILKKQRSGNNKMIEMKPQTN